MRTIITILFAKLIKRRNQKWITNPIKRQTKTFNKLLTSASSTTFGQDHGFSKISSYEDFKKRVPVRDYEGLKSYVDKVVEGKKDILWHTYELMLLNTQFPLRML